MKKVFGIIAIAVSLSADVWAEEKPAKDAAFTDWQKLVTVLQQHYLDKDAVKSELLNDAAVQGILKALGGRAQLLDKTAVAGAPSKPVQAIGRAEAINGTVGYVRFNDVNATAAAALDKELAKWGKDGMGGIILDLRFAGGGNFADAAAVASRFLLKGTPLFSVKSNGEEKPREFVNADFQGGETPLVVLINSQTRDGAEALAACLSAHGRAVVVGNLSSGTAATQSDVPLDGRHVLRLATGRVVFAKGLEVFPKGLNPDLPVTISEALEKDILIDHPTDRSFTELFAPQSAKGRLNEAELVKTHKGEETALMQPTGAAAPKIEEVRDVVLQRAVDLLKGIAILNGRS